MEKAAAQMGKLLVRRSLYGSARLGILQPGVRWYPGNMPTPNPYFTDTTTLHEGWKSYEITNHLGNVMATINDRKAQFDTDSDDVADYYEAAVMTATDYFPFGAPMRQYQSTDYRYGFNGKETEHDGEFAATVHYDYGFRVYHPAVGRFLSVDPLAGKYVGWSPYNFVEGNPIINIDPDGRSTESTHTDEKGNVIAVYNDGDLGVYRHDDATSQAEVDAKREKSGSTSGGGKTMGKTNYWWDFAEIDTRNDIAHERPASGAIIHFGISRDAYIKGLYDTAVDAMPTSTDPRAAGAWLASQAANGEPLDIKTKIGYTDGYLFKGKYVSGRALGNHLFGSLLRKTRPFYVNPRTWYGQTMQKVGEYNATQNKTTFGSGKPPFYGENKISGNYIARGYWGENWLKAYNFKSGNYGY